MNITLVFFIYGLAFFILGVAIMLESSRSPLLAEAGVLWPLAVFGFVHGAHEWLEMFLERSDWLAFQHPAQVGWLRVSILIFSFACLAIFGGRMIKPGRKLSPDETAGWGAALGLYILFVLLAGFSFPGSHADWLYIDVLVRYFLAIPAAALAGFALFRQATLYQSQARHKLALSFRYAALGFSFYSLSQIVVSPLDFFPANYLNTVSFVEATGLPIQVIRAVCAVVIMVSMIRAIQAVEDERQQELLSAQQARLEALEQVRTELVERETLRRELLQHIVIAQEDERSRIARELHDEAAQILTAFSLHVAALRDAAPRNAKVKNQVGFLQSLSHQMSLAIYRLVHDLRPAQLDDLGLAAALQYLGNESRERFGLEVCVQINGTRQRLDPLVETVCFRVAQEALGNVARHAGVKQAELQLDFSPQLVSMRVSDQGVGFDPDARQLPPRGWGLAGMRERAESVGGRIELKTTFGFGTTIELTVPLSKTGDAFQETNLKNPEPFDPINPNGGNYGNHPPDVG